jgi:hypothetical protein
VRDRKTVGMIDFLYGKSVVVCKEEGCGKVWAEEGEGSGGSIYGQDARETRLC